MIEKDTVRLLRECDAGIKMGVSSIDDVIDYASDSKLRTLLTDSRNNHETLKSEVQNLLDKYHDDGKEPNPMAKGMSWIKTNAKMIANESDNTISDLMIDGCDMGVKSLSRYLNQYAAADEKSKDITKRLIRLEEGLSANLRQFL